MELELAILLSVIAFIIGAVISGFILFRMGIKYRRKTAEVTIGSAETEAQRIVEDAKKEAESMKKEALIEAKDEIHKTRSEVEKELKERRSEVSRQERRLQQKEESLDRKIDNVEKKEEVLQGKLKTVEEKLSEADRIKNSQLEMLERISEFSREQAKEYLLKSLEEELVHDKAVKIAGFESQLKEECEDKARQYISLAIARCAADQVSETAVSVVPLPNEDMKGRIIGREGRNIRALETLTGIDLIIDDTPEAVILSGYHPIRREVARIALERLIVDGRIHPARIEEMVEKAKKEVDNVIRQEGENATYETGVYGLHPEMIKLLGRLKYRTSYGQSVLIHSIEVSRLAGVMAAELGVDVNLAKRAGLVHDIGKSVDFEQEGSHIEIGAELAKRYKESPEVINAIMSHHGDVEPTSIISVLVQAADSISAARPGARRETLEAYVKRLEKLEEIAQSFDGVDKTYAIQAGREIRIMVKPDKISDDDMVILSKDIAKKIEDDMEYPGQIKVTMIRETREVATAK